MGIPRAQLEAWGVKIPASTAAAAPRRNKFGVSPVEDRTTNGIKFASKKEATYYGKLEMMRRVGTVSWFTRQVPFYLPGGVRYLADFLVVYSDGRLEVVDVKGMRTKEYIIKRRMVEDLFRPLKIKEV